MKKLKEYIILKCDFEFLWKTPEKSSKMDLF